MEDSESIVSEGEDIKVVKMVMGYLARYNNYIESIDGISNEEDAPATQGNVCEEEDFTNVLRESNIPSYEGARTTRLVALLFLFICFTMFGVSNACADEILKVVIELFPTGNILPKSNYEGKKYLQMLGLSYDSMYYCPS